MFRKGRKLRSMSEVQKHIGRGNYIFMLDKPQHPGWIRSMQYGTVLGFLQQGYLREALRNQ